MKAYTNYEMAAHEAVEKLMALADVHPWMSAAIVAIFQEKKRQGFKEGFIAALMTEEHQSLEAAEAFYYVYMEQKHE